MPFNPPYLELTGTLLQIGTADHVNPKFWKREIILEVTDADEPGDGPIKIEFVQHLMDLLDEVQEGSKVTVRFTVLGRPYRAGREGYLVVLRGHYLKVHPEKGKPKRSDNRKKEQLIPLSKSNIRQDEEPPFDEPGSPSEFVGFAPNTLRLGSKMKEVPKSFKPVRSASLDEEPPF